MEEQKLHTDLEQAHLDLALLEVEVDEKEFAQKLYEDRKDHEIEERKKLKEKNGELTKQLEDKEQINRMRIQKRLNETRTKEVKDMIATEQAGKEFIANMQTKLRDEK